MDKQTLTIGIPAYNEAGNIGYLLDDLVGQNHTNYILEKIVVASDASEDNTDQIVKDKGTTNSVIVLIENKQRQGQAAKQNQIIETCTSDILVLLNADILIEGKDFINALVGEIISGADLTCGPLLGINPKTYFEKVLTIGAEVRKEAFEKYKKGNNMFTCHGSHRAMSKKFYTNFRFRGSIAEDAYSYLFCISNGYKYSYTFEALARVKLPNNFSDHLKQSSRFFSLSQKLGSEFDRTILDENTKFPAKELKAELVKHFFEKPVETLLYALTCSYVLLYTKLGFNDKSEKWKPVASSKVLRG